MSGYIRPCHGVRPDHNVELFSIKIFYFIFLSVTEKEGERANYESELVFFSPLDLIQKYIFS